MFESNPRLLKLFSLLIPYPKQSLLSFNLIQKNNLLILFISYQQTILQQMSNIDTKTPQNTILKRIQKKEEPLRNLKTATSSTDLRKLYAEGIARQTRPLLKKTPNQPNIKMHLSKSPSAKDTDERLKFSMGNPEKDNKRPSIKPTYRQQISKLSREKDIIQNAYFQLTHKYFGVLSEMQEQKQKHQIQKSLLQQQIKELREIVGKASSKQIHHLFQVPVRGPPPSQSKIINEIDEAYETSNIHLSIPSVLDKRKQSFASESNLSSLQIQSNEGSNIEAPLSSIKK